MVEASEDRIAKVPGAPGWSVLVTPLDTRTESP